MDIEEEKLLMMSDTSINKLPYAARNAQKGLYERTLLISVKRILLIIFYHLFVNRSGINRPVFSRQGVPGNGFQGCVYGGINESG